MDEVVAVIFACFVALIVGFVGGAGSDAGTWEKDCKLLGMHREGDAVYTCAKK